MESVRVCELARSRFSTDSSVAFESGLWQKVKRVGVMREATLHEDNFIIIF